MSHLLKEYSKSLEVEPKKPVVNKHFYPITPEKYIVLYNEQDIGSKNYRYYSLVVDLVSHELKRKNINVVIIGSGKDMSNRADYVYPNLSFRKNCYIVSKADLLISVDNAITQYASSQNVPIINLYGNIYPSITTPYWSDKNKKIDLEPEWNIKPCLALEDPDDSINKIQAEKVAESILKILDPNRKSKINFKTKLINKIKDFSIDVIPTNYVKLPIFENSTINLRLDKGKTEESSFYQYCANHNCNIFVEDFVIQPEGIKNFSKNINSIKLFLNSKPQAIPKKYFELLKRLKIDIHILVKNKDILDDIRFEYFDQNVELYEPRSEKPKEVSAKDRFFSFKMVVEGDKVYKSSYHWKNNIDNEDNIVDNADYWEESDYFYIYEQDRD
mgnify:FL=1